MSFDGGRWARRMAFVLRVVGGAPLDAEPPAGRPILALDGELAGATRAVAERLNSLLADGATVGEYLSVTTGRVFGNMAESRDELSEGRAPIDALDATIADLAAFVGLWNESTVRGPAWRFGDIGRRVERSLVVLGLVDSCLRRVEVAPSTATAIRATPAASPLGPSSRPTSSTARRSRCCWPRTRASSPTAATTAATSSWRPPPSCCCTTSTTRARTRRRCGASPSTSRPWSGARAGGPSRRWRRCSTATTRSSGCGKAYEAVEAFGRLVVETWFATPVNPMLVRGRLR